MFNIKSLSLGLLAGLFALNTVAWAACGGVTDGLVACYPFDGDVNDESGNSLNGSVVGTPNLTADRFGNGGKAYYFDGKSHIKVEHSPLLNVNQHTIAAWIKPEQKTSQDIGSTGRGIIGKVKPFTYETLSFGLEKDNYFSTGFATSSEIHHPLKSSSIVENNQWHFVVMSYDGTKVTFYRDGLVDVSYPRTGTVRTNTNSLAIGRHGGDANQFGDDNFFKGTMDEVRIYNRALTEAEIKQLYVGNTTCPADTNGSTQTGIDLVKATPANYGLFTQAQIDAAKQTGIQSCKDNPASCGLFNQTQYDAAKQVGIDLVKAKPNDYGITIKSLGGFTQDELNVAKTTSIQDGINQCKTNPNSFGLFTQAQLDAAKQTGIDLVKAKPNDYNLFSATDVSNKETIAKQTGVQEGINKCKTDPVSCGIMVSNDQCKTNPSSCGLFTQDQLNAEKETSKQNGIEFCKNDPNCKGIHATYNPLNGEVHIPFIDVPNGIGFTQTFDVYLMQRNGSFTFDLDLSRIVIVH